MAGVVRSHDVAPPRANWGFRNSAPEWRWFWRGCRGLWRLDYPDTAYNVTTRDGGDAGGGHIGWDGASVATTPFGRGVAAGGGMAVTSPDPGFWHDAVAERTWFGVCTIERAAAGSFDLFIEGGSAGGVDLSYAAASDRLRCTFYPGAANVDLTIADDPMRLVAWAATYWDTDNTGTFFVDGRRVGTAATSGAMAAHGAQPVLWGSSAGSDGTLLLFGVATRAWGDGEATRWTADPFASLRVWRPVQAAGGTTHALSGTLPLAFTLDGDLAVRRALSGTLPLALTLDGGLAVRHALGGTLPLALTLAGPIEVRRALAGTLPLALQLSGALATGPAALGELVLSDAAPGGLAATVAAFGGIGLVDTAASGGLEVSDG